MISVALGFGMGVHMEAVSPRIVVSVSECVSLWAAHESGMGEERVSGVFPKGWGRYSPAMEGATESAQAHDYVSQLRTYAHSYPVLWWSVFRGPAAGFDAKRFLRDRRGLMVGSPQAGMGELGYEGRLPATVLELFLKCLENKLSAAPLEVWPVTEVLCDADIAQAIADEVSAKVDSKYRRMAERF